MLQQPVTVRCATCNKRHKTKLTVTLDEDCYEDYTGWIVTEDDLIRIKEETTRLKDKQGHVRFYKIEVVSRVLSAEMNRDTRQSRDQPEHTHSITFNEEISAVLGIINAYSLYMSGQCGKRKKTYSLEDVDLLDQDVDLLDRVRTERYPEHMFAESTDLKKAAHQYSAGASAVVIQNAPTVLALDSLMANAQESTINIANICVFPWDGESPDKKMTIELHY
ncbi:hypothetical protein D0869_07968 [Hortaea werneckii]|uniref:Uncharacterized protein n=1 Tax=Hortaea werneckii TaxID=91943 RepID=A0A3M6YEL8_HORWE|nr:hypothetical protein D0869_07968 [Hortaea werneckii]RMY01267.1 hypothetical protein D0868_08582 [Hortaea werneckii]